jgi:phage shock protein A
VNFWARLLLALHIRFGSVRNEVEDPRAALDLAYQRQLELQAKMRRAVADVVTARKRLELQARQLEVSTERLEDRARAALEEGRQDAARELLTQRAVIRGELGELERHSGALAAEESGLVEASQRLDLQVHQFRIRRETVKAAYLAARARQQVGEALMEATREEAELRLAVERAERSIAGTRARAAALEGVLTRGALERGGWASAEELQRELDVHPADAEVAAELARLEGELLWKRQALDSHDET